MDRVGLKPVLIKFSTVVLEPSIKRPVQRESEDVCNVHDTNETALVVRATSAPDALACDFCISRISKEGIVGHTIEVPGEGGVGPRINTLRIYRYNIYMV